MSVNFRRGSSQFLLQISIKKEFTVVLIYVVTESLFVVSVVLLDAVAVDFDSVVVSS